MLSDECCKGKRSCQLISKKSHNQVMYIICIHLEKEGKSYFITGEIKFYGKNNYQELCT